MNLVLVILGAFFGLIVPLFQAKNLLPCYLTNWCYCLTDLLLLSNCYYCRCWFGAAASGKLLLLPFFLNFVLTQLCFLTVTTLTLTYFSLYLSSWILQKMGGRKRKVNVFYEGNGLLFSLGAATALLFHSSSHLAELHRRLQGSKKKEG